jgi:hypothetical protein
VVNCPHGLELTQGLGLTQGRHPSHTHGVGGRSGGAIQSARRLRRTAASATNTCANTKSSCCAAFGPPRSTAHSGGSADLGEKLRRISLPPAIPRPAGVRAASGVRIGRCTGTADPPGICAQSAPGRPAGGAYFRGQVRAGAFGSEPERQAWPLAGTKDPLMPHRCLN